MPAARSEVAVVRRIVEAELIDPLRDPGWDEWVSAHPQATIFHSSAWARVLQETYGHRPCYIRMSVEGELLALVPMMEVQSLISGSRGVCVPFSDSCAPLLTSSFGQDLIVDKLRQIGHERGWRYFEVRDDSILPAGAPASGIYFSHILDLRPGFDALNAAFATSARSAARKAERSGLSVRLHTTPEAISAFYRLHMRTRRKHGVPPQPHSFFANIQKHVLNAGHGFVILVEREGRAIAASVFFKFGRRALFKFGASDERLQELRANNLAMSEAIRALSQDGMESLDFGRTERDNDGLRRFKLSWGSKESELRYGKFSLANDNWTRRASPGTAYRSFFRAMPLSISRLAGAMIYPHLD